jgi:hypothetical protein
MVSFMNYIRNNYTTKNIPRQCQLGNHEWQLITSTLTDDNDLDEESTDEIHHQYRCIYCGKIETE